MLKFSAPSHRFAFHCFASLAMLLASGIMNSLSWAQSSADRPLMAYVGTFSSPLRDTLPTQVDLPPGNGRGIHIFQVDRQSGALKPAGDFELGTSPSCLVINRAGTHLYSANETDRVGEKKEGTVSSFKIDAANGQLTMLNTVNAGGAGPTYVSIHPGGRFLLVAITSVVQSQCCQFCLMANWEMPRISKMTKARSDQRVQRTHHPAVSLSAVMIALTLIRSKPIQAASSYCMSTWGSTRSSSGVRRANRKANTNRTRPHRSASR